MARRRLGPGVRGPEEAAEEYQQSIQNIDRPNWNTRRIQVMTRRWIERTGDYLRFIEQAKPIILKYAPSGMLPNYLRCVLQARRLAEAGVPQEEYNALLNACIIVNGVDKDTLNAVLAELGLPQVG